MGKRHLDMVERVGSLPTNTTSDVIFKNSVSPIIFKCKGSSLRRVAQLARAPP